MRNYFTFYNIPFLNLVSDDGKPDIVITTSKKDIFILIYSTYSKAAYANGIFKCIIVNNDD
jgi:hypothetical protein